MAGLADKTELTGKSECDLVAEDDALPMKTVRM